MCNDSDGWFTNLNFKPVPMGDWIEHKPNDEFSSLLVILKRIALAQGHMDNLGYK